MTRAEIIALQRQLNADGSRLVVDGVYGQRTAEAYQDWLNQHTPENVATPAPPAAKPWYLSRAVIGILIAGVALIANYWGVEIDVEKATELAVAGAGLVLALVGTVRRKSSIDPTLVAFGLRLPARANKVPADEPAASHLRGPFGY